ncbi:unnamed protein product [Symbiodinium microadriaticum]|nr:unnamed protein product [Symbiodinium microadriaticum]CAE7547798.1 unnamed protein product [Symbiodinium sp. KB8]
MKRSATVAGVLEIGQGVCKLKLKNLTFQSEAASSSNTSTSQSPTSSSIANVPDVANVIEQIKSGDLVTRASEKTITSRQIQSHVCYIQRTLSFVAGIKSGWSEQAQEAFQTWLAAPKKRSRTLTAMQALTNGEVEAEGSADIMNSRQPLATPFRVQNNTALSHQDLADDITPVGPITTNDTPPSTRTHATSTSRRVMSPIRTTRPPPTRTQTTSTSSRVMSPIQARIRRPEAVLRLWQFRTFRYGPLSGTMCGTRVMNSEHPRLIDLPDNIRARVLKFFDASVPIAWDVVRVFCNNHPKVINYKVANNSDRLIAPSLTLRGLVLLGRAGIGKNPLGIILSLALARHYVSTRGPEGAAVGWRRSKQIDGFRERLGELHFPVLLNDPILANMNFEDVKSFLDVGETCLVDARYKLPNSCEITMPHLTAILKRATVILAGNKAVYVRIASEQQSEVIHRFEGTDLRRIGYPASTRTSLHAQSDDL